MSYLKDLQKDILEGKELVRQLRNLDNYHVIFNPGEQSSIENIEKQLLDKVHFVERIYNSSD